MLSVEELVGADSEVSEGVGGASGELGVGTGVNGGHGQPSYTSSQQSGQFSGLELPSYSKKPEQLFVGEKLIEGVSLIEEEGVPLAVLVTVIVEEGVSLIVEEGVPLIVGVGAGVPLIVGVGAGVSVEERVPLIVGVGGGVQ